MKKFTFIIVLLAVVLAAGAQKRPKAIVKLEKQLVGKFVEIPATHYTVSIKDEDGNVQSRKEVTTAGFYMLETEVSYASYKSFLEDLKAQGRMADYDKARIQDTALERISQQYKNWSAPDFDPFPVANISYEGALLFCQWLTDKVGSEEWEYTLPSKVDWQVAAQGGNPTAQYSTGHQFVQGEPYHSFSRNQYTYLQIPQFILTKKEDGCCTVNGMGISRTYPLVRKIKLENGEEHVSVWPSTTFVRSHDKNPYGLYNMCGNVAEMVYGESIALGGSYNDPGYDIRIQSEKPYTGPSPMIGFRVIAVPKTR